MENQNQHYGTHESMYVEDPNNEKQFLHSEDEEKPEVTGDPSETAEDHDLNPEAKNIGEADVDSLLEEMNDTDPEENDIDTNNSLRADPKEPDDEDDDDDDDDPGLDDDDDLSIEPDGDNIDDEDLDDADLDDDLIDKELSIDDKDLDLDDDEDEDTFLK